ncbi:hypothetical protein BLA60_22515 [Actinophytocola xinjiangensis]|uniref:Neocarzinostatin family protein n=1 Tax=Actinophytocola xinjiangensis TaxID=485602 RepID=A0A7Z0WJK1_9PSEU|nr:hypothetical protein [Actinophytocola xinjiangensis]OLF08784.1 hypothetical protein BLA60_22515 [Actinophytocola xinjiangensis]
MVEDPSPRSRTAWALAVTTFVLALLAGAGQATAAPRITVSKTSGLNPAGDTITVNGTGFDVTKGIYVAVCVDNGPGQVPTPCLGGVDTGGSGGGSAWISSNPPSYGNGLATPYGPGGSFSVTLTVAAIDPVTGTDCRRVACAAVTRADHTRTGDRSQDARIPLSFAAPAPKPTPTTQAPPPPPPATTTTVAPTTTTTTAPPSTTTAPPSSAAATTTAAEITETAAAPTAPDRTGWWLGGGAAVLAAAAVLVVLRVRRARAATPSDPS